MLEKNAGKCLEQKGKLRTKSQLKRIQHLTNSERCRIRLLYGMLGLRHVIAQTNPRHKELSWVQPNHQSKASIVNVSTNIGHANVSAASLQRITVGVKAEWTNERTDREWSVFFHPADAFKCVQLISCTAKCAIVCVDLYTYEFSRR